MDNYFPLNLERIKTAVAKTSVSFQGIHLTNPKILTEFDFGILQNPEILTSNEKSRLEKSREILEKFKKKEW